MMLSSTTQSYSACGTPNEIYYMTDRSEFSCREDCDLERESTNSGSRLYLQMDNQNRVRLIRTDASCVESIKIL